MKVLLSLMCCVVKINFLNCANNNDFITKVPKGCSEGNTAQ